MSKKDWLAIVESFSQNRGALIGLIMFTLLVLMAIFADVLAPHDPIQQYRDNFLQPPAWQENGSAEFLFGTDATGRDILSRIIHGARFSLAIGMTVIVLASFVGILMGLAAGFYGGFFDKFVMRLMDIILAFPSLLLALVLVAILGPGLLNSMLALTVVYMPHFVRLTRATVMVEKKKEYFIADQVIGASDIYLMLRTLLPNCLAPIIVQATLNFSSTILEAAALGFLGLGAQPPTPEWGTMLAESREFILRAWWVVTLPGLAILLTVLCINLMGDGVRDALDPRLKK